MEIITSAKISLGITLFFLLALLIFAFFRLFSYMTKYMRLSREHEELVVRYLPVSELVVWVLYFTWGIQFLYERGYILFFAPLLVFIIIILYLAWFVLKDIIAGVIYRTTGNPAIGDTITVSGITGRITGIRYNYLQLEDSSGKQVNIPYSRISGNILMRQSPSESLSSHNFTIVVPIMESNNDLFDTMLKLRQAIIMLPWISQKKEPKIALLAEDEKEHRFSVTIFSIDESYFLRTEKSLEEQFRATVIRHQNQATQNNY